MSGKIKQTKQEREDLKMKNKELENEVILL